MIIININITWHQQEIITQQAVGKTEQSVANNMGVSINTIRYHKKKLFNMSVFAATGCQGYAVHRDGALEGINWHAGIMGESSADKYLPVLHIGGLGEGVTWCSWDDFLDGDNFKGVYKPDSGISSSGRDLIVAMGRDLRTEDLGYTPLSQIDHFIFDSSAKVEPDDIWLIRCDGVVEYCYEYHGYRIYGSNSLWDISKGGLATLAHHSLSIITPKKQAEDYMTLVQSSEP